MKLSLPRIAGIVIILMWAASLALPVFTPCGGTEKFPGWLLLMLGVMGLMVLQPAWLANFLMLIVAVMLIVRGHAPIWLGIVTAAIAGCAWFFTEWYGDNPTHVAICHYHAGYWLWLAAAGVSLLACLIVRPQAKAPAP